MQVAHTCESHGAAACETYPFDLLNTAEIDLLAQKVLGNQQVDVLVNNAGMMVAGSAHQGTALTLLTQQVACSNRSVLDLQYERCHSAIGTLQAT